MDEDLASSIDVDSLVAEIMLLRAADDKAVLILEGPTDAKVFQHLVDLSACDLQIAWGRQNALGVLKKARAKNIGAILCIVDQDYDSFVGRIAADPDICITDEHDMEMLIIRSRAFDKVLSEMASSSKLTKFGGDIRSYLRDITYAIGVVRLFSIVNDLNLRFEGLKWRCIERRTMTIDREKMLKEIMAHSKVTFEVAKFEAFLGERKDSEKNQWLMCCGHDFSLVLSKALQTMIGSHNTSEVDSQLLETQLRLSYEREMFRETDLYKQITSWEARNSRQFCHHGDAVMSPP